MNRSTLLILATTVSASLLSSHASNAAVVVSGPSASSVLIAGDVTGSARYRNFRSGGGHEHFLGRNNLGQGSNRVQGDITWLNGDNPFSFSLSGGTLSSTMNGNTLSIANFLTFANAGTQPFDTLQFALTDGDAGQGTFSFTGLTLSGTDYQGNAVVNHALANLVATDNGGTIYYTVTGIDFRQNFTLTGKLTRAGTFAQSQERNKAEITIGNGPIIQSPVPEPASWVMMIAGFSLVGGFLRSRKSVHA